MAKKQTSFFISPDEKGINHGKAGVFSDIVIHVGFGAIEINGFGTSIEIALKDCNKDLLNVLEDLCEAVTSAVREEKEKIYR